MMLSWGFIQIWQKTYKLRRINLNDRSRKANVTDLQISLSLIEFRFNIVHFIHEFLFFLLGHNNKTIFLKLF